MLDAYWNGILQISLLKDIDYENRKASLFIVLDGHSNVIEQKDEASIRKKYYSHLHPLTGRRRPPWRFRQARTNKRNTRLSIARDADSG
jgi:hypothetical protein